MKPAIRWTEEQAWKWYRSQPWICGFNFNPSTASNSTDFWQEETFDEETIRREIRLGRSLGFRSVRVWLQYWVWKEQRDGFHRRFRTFLDICGEAGLTVVPVLFCDCAFGYPPTTEPYLGKQKEPVPGVMLPSWTPSPGHRAAKEPGSHPLLKTYVTEMIGTYRDNPIILMWDLYNEPSQSGMDRQCVPLLESSFAWAREAAPSQPLTVAVWEDRLPDLNQMIIELSDIVTYHAYTDYEGMKEAIIKYKSYGKPVICTEWMGRVDGSRIERELPLFKKEGVGNYLFGLVNGKMQGHYHWSHLPGDPEHERWQFDLFHSDYTPYDPAETEFIRAFLQAAEDSNE